MPLSKHFKDKSVIITGASEGIGRALALKMATDGARLTIAARNEVRLQELASQCRQAGATVQVVVADLSIREDCEQLIKASIAAFGAIDVLVNNAGMTLWADFEAMTDPDLLRRVVEINYYSVAYTTYFALPYLRQSQGRLVATSSLGGVIGVPGHAAYGASKHAIHGLYDSLRIELQDSGVSVTIICPDFVVTELHEKGFNAEGQPMRRRLKPNQGMAASDCADLMYAAIRDRRRILITSRRGRLALIFRSLVPKIVDQLTLRSAKKLGLH